MIGKPTLNPLPPSLGNAVKNLGSALGIGSIGGSSGAGIVTAPWDISYKSDSFFTPITIDGKRYNQIYPYRLLVVEKKNNENAYQIYGGDGFNSIGVNVGRLTIDKADTGTAGAWRMSFQSMQSLAGSKWEYNLPITPQQLSISSIYTTHTTPTLNGIVEEHNGVKFKIVTAQGSFGVWPDRPNKNEFQVPNIFSGAISTLFGGTIQAATNTINQISRTIRSVTSDHPEAAPTVKQLNEAPAAYYGTGYAQALLLDQFLEQYAELKKTKEGKNLRLALDIPKQNQTFLVSPMQFAYFQSADSPNEYKFNLQLKAWRRIQLSAADSASAINLDTAVRLTTDVLRRALNTITEARRTLASVSAIIGAVNSDATTIFNSIGEVSALIKNLLGIPLALTDLPFALKNNWKTQVSDAYDSVFKAGGFADQAFSQISSNFNQLFNQSEGLAPSQLLNGQLGTSASFAASQLINQTQSSDPQNPTNSTQNSLDENTPVTSLNLNQQQTDQLQNYIDTVNLLTTQDLIQILNQIQDLQFQMSNLFNAGNDTYNLIYQKPPKFNRGYETTLDEYLILKSLYDLIQQLQSLTATDQLNESKTTSAIDFVQSLAQQNGVTFNDQISAIRAPVPFGLTIEQIAARYLGDPDRWIEIATLNALKEPYIDETGFTYDLISNAIGRQFNLSTKENLYYGQKIIISAIGQPNTLRSIIDIEEIAANNYLITVDGEANLDTYTTLSSANIKGYLAGTVNSQNFIYIPSTLPVPPDLAIRPIPATESDPLTKLSDVDLLLTDNFDIAIDSVGEFKLAFGMQNLIQALKIKLLTQKGTLIKHPDFGLSAGVGSSASDTSAQQLLQDITNTILEDDRFSGLEKIQVDIKPPRINISLAVTLANGNGVFPLSFTLGQ